MKHLIRWSTCAVVLLACTAGCQGPQSVEATPTLQRQRVSQLEARVQRLQHINDIKRLQRTYGYYLDEGQWDDAADLFAEQATLEIGKDGVFRGRDHIRAYFRALGGGRNGLAPGRLNEQLQVMPLITMNADGQHANGTWRAILLSGQLGRDAFWGEGPYEMQYVRENGIWKISSLHWFQTLFVPYEGGWAKNPDGNEGRFINSALQPDAPSTVQYKTWPGAFTPPFHFRGQYPGLMPVSSSMQVAGERAGTLNNRIAQLLVDAQQLTDQGEIETLQCIYGFYLDKGLWSEAVALLSDDAELEIQGRGIFRGRQRILEYLRAVGPEGLQAGRLYDNMQLQPITHIDRSGVTAKARWHVFSQLAQHGKFHEWATAVHENEYQKAPDGKWRIRRLHVYPTMVTPYEQGWGKVSLAASRFEPTLTPDSPSRGPASNYDRAFVAPFHYAHPVRKASSPDPVRATRPAPADSLATVERQIAVAEDQFSIENIQTAYGYYLATLLWDDLTALFADDGTIEIALRGIYVGRPAVRRHLNLYGQAGLDDGVLHNHMQFQHVIHVAPDGSTAKLRSRAMSMMGNYERNATWMGGTYENEFVKIDGRWRFHRDHLINTYFAIYETGWKDMVPRAPPGITDSNPPDLPPSMPFDMYPKNFLLPFHYVNPVTGKAFQAPATN
ncbi:MAG: nuclear transport factor 2 family protein [Steroidobacteraceae bacterium]